MPAIQLTEDAKQVLTAYSWPGNIRQLKNITEQISIIETNRDITPDILRNYLPAQSESRLPALFGVKPQRNGKGFESEREILYQVLFDMRRDVTELKKLVHDIMAERGTSVPVGGRPSEADMHYIPNTSVSLVSDTQPVVMHTVSNVTPVANVNPVKISSGDVSEVQDTEEYIEENLSLDDVEKEMIRKALERHHGKRKNAANDLKISERTLYRKIKEYGLD